VCGRFTLHTEKELLTRRFRVEPEQLAAYRPSYNVAPTQAVLTVRRVEAARRAEPMRWGLVPGWAKDPGKLPSMINARVETAPSRPAYRRPFRHQRCLILADGFYEWQAPVAPRRRRIPHWISLETREPFAMAGLWSLWRPPGPDSAEPVLSCTILTTDANPALAPIHARMPVILRPTDEAMWLDPALDDRVERLRELLAGLPAEHFRSHPVSVRVNSPRNDGPELILPDDPPELGFS
jgi:putative SOS response-associated peptidase YedK